jgi:ornithine decarboxylase
MDLGKVAASYQALQTHFPTAAIHYAVKANPAPEVVRQLVTIGSRFDVASPSEIDLCLAAGALPEDLSYGNTIKRSRDIAYAFQRGLRLFAFDCEEELEKLAAHAPGADVFCRIAVSSEGACWPLGRKFGCSTALAERLLESCPRRGLNPCGVSFHVGSQQTDPSRWGAPIAETAGLFGRLARRGIRLTTVNLGGGFPARYNAPAPELAAYRDAIRQALDKHLSPWNPRPLLEPGRGLVGDAGAIVTEVILVSRRDPERRWVYLDAGKFGGLAETMDECIQYRIRARGAQPGAPQGPVILAGPTCDSADVLYEKTVYQLPLDLGEGDQLEILSAGAYTSSYSSVGFNGFSPLPVYFV